MFGQIQYIDCEKEYDTSSKILTYCLKKVGLEKQKNNKLKTKVITEKLDIKPLYLDSNNNDSYKIVYFLSEEDNVTTKIINRPGKFILLYPYATLYLDNFEALKDNLNVKVITILFNYNFNYSITNELSPITIHNIMIENTKLVIHEYTGQNIFIFKNIFDDIFCNKIVKIADIIDNEGHMTYERKKNQEVKNQNVECKYIHLSKLISLDKFSVDSKELDDTIYKNFNICMKILHILKKFDTTSDSGYCLRKIFGETYAHADGLEPTSNGVRCLSVISQFNDNFSGGIYRFPYINVTKRLDKGDVIAFPPYWSHMHLTTPVAQNEYRYTVNTWFYNSLERKAE